MLMKITGCWSDRFCDMLFSGYLIFSPNFSVSFKARFLVSCVMSIGIIGIKLIKIE